MPANKPEIRFYHLQKQSLDEALPAITSKAYQNGHKIVILLPDEKTTEHFNTLLWTYIEHSFLPHGSKKDGNPSAQPIWLTHLPDDNPNKADLLICTHGTESADLEQYALCCDMFDGHNNSQVQKARERWKNAKKNGHKIAYWQQNEQGQWHEKATENSS